MKNLTVMNKNGVLCVDSREVAEILGIEHKELFRKVKGGKNLKGYIELISEQYLIVEDYFIPSTYQDEDGKTKKNFLLTRLGCQFIAQNELESEVTVFTSNYVKNFNKIKPEYKKIQAAEMEAVKKLIYYANTKGKNNIENYYKLQKKLAHKIIDRVRGERELEEFNQSSKEMVFNYTIDSILLAGIKLNLSEEEICEVYRERIEAFQKAISQDYKG